jgi:CRISPR-associated protein Cas5d
MKAERVSYDVITPSAARGILEAIYWKPEINWIVDQITVLNHIKFDNIRRNEISSKISLANVRKAMKGIDVELCQYANDVRQRQQRATMMLRDVAYTIKAHFELRRSSDGEEVAKKHYNVFLRRARNGQCYHHPYFGCREFPVNFRLIEENEEKQVSIYAGEKDLGWMLNDLDYSRQMTPRFFRAIMNDGVITVPRLEGVEAK